jgi:hypothetical protein
MDKNKYSIFWEIIRCTFGLGIIYYFGDWFGLKSYLTLCNYIIIGYFIISISMNLYLIQNGFENQKTISK